LNVRTFGEAPASFGNPAQEVLAGADDNIRTFDTLAFEEIARELIK
jgi:hypothetical protein